jgi:1-acyl-sn-glycerol-3-phosphate acyltransferase
MIPASPNSFYTTFFSWYSSMLMKRHFRTISIHGNYTEREVPILLISNHFSWWDGFIQLYLNRRVFTKNFHVMMLEEQLLKHRFLSKCGAYSVQKKSKGILESMKYTIELLNHKRNLVLVFPQGKIESIYTFPFTFEKGIEHIIRRCSQEIQIIFNVNLVDYFSKNKPELSIYFEEYEQKQPITIELLEQHFNEFAKKCMTQQHE